MKHKHSIPTHVGNLLGIMADNRPRTLKQLSNELGLQETSIMSYMGILRRGYGFNITKRYTGKAGKKQIWEYKLIN